MSTKTDQYNSEAIMIAMLALQADLTGVNIVHFDNEAQASKTAKDRIVVEASPPETFDDGINPASPFMMQCMTKVTLKMVSNDVALLDKYMAAIIAANAPGVCPASIVTLATSLFGARLFTWHFTAENERMDTPAVRTWSITWKAVFGA